MSNSGERVAISERRPLEKGEVLNGCYELIGVLGEGGMGRVWEARDRHLDRVVAVKEPWQRVHGLQTEARAMARLHHAGLPSVYAFGNHRGVEYFVMERLVGLSLRTHLSGRRGTFFSVDEVLDICIGIADAVGAVHRGGYVHRDLKPENVMLVAGDRVVLLDFGVMQTFDEAAREKDVMGSPPYLAPEVAMRRVSPKHAASIDVYALGAIAFELLTGQLVFRGETAAEIIERQIHVPPPSLLARRRSIPERLARLVESMLSRDPTKRPYSIDVVATSLRALRRSRHNNSGTAPFSVLIADDDPDIRLMLEACVEHAAPGAEIRFASDGDTALRRFQERPPHVLLLDLRMPGLNGVELCMHLRGTSLSEQTAIIAVSAYADEDTRRLLASLGVSNFVSKRSGSNEVIRELVELVRGIHQARAHILGPDVAA